MWDGWHSWMKEEPPAAAVREPNPGDEVTRLCHELDIDAIFHGAQSVGQRARNINTVLIYLLQREKERMK